MEGNDPTVQCKTKHTPTHRQIMQPKKQKDKLKAQPGCMN